MSILNPAANWRASQELTVLLTRHRQLAWEMTRRELTERFAGHLGGALWALGHPLITIGVYLFLFGVVFAQKVEAKGMSLPLDYSVYMLAGLLPWLMMSEALTKSASAIIGNSNLVKQVVFPVEILPVKVVLAAVLTQCIFFAALIIYMLARFRGLPATMSLLPLLMLLQAMASAGLAFAISSLACYLRDLREFVTVFCTINFFLMPVVFLPDMVPAMFRPLLFLNPFSYMIWCYQDAIFFGRIEHPWAWVVFSVLSVTCLAVGYRTFRRLKTHFGNVL